MPPITGNRFRPSARPIPWVIALCACLFGPPRVDGQPIGRISLLKTELYRDSAVPSARMIAAVFLFSETDLSARNTLLDALKPGSPIAVRTAVCMAINGDQILATPGPTFDDPVFECLREPDAGLRAEAAASVGRLCVRPDSQLFARLRDELAKRDLPADYRATLVRALGNVHTRASVALLMQQFKGADAAMEAEVVDGLQRITARTDLTLARQWREVAPLLLQMSDEDFLEQARRMRVRRMRDLVRERQGMEEDITAAEESLYKFRPDDQKPALLIERLRHRQPCIRVWAAGRLITLPDKDFNEAMLPPLLEGMVQPEHARVRSACAAAVAYVERRLTRPANTQPMGPERIRGQLRRETQTEVVAALITALADYQLPDDDVEAVGAFLSDPREPVAEAACNAFRRLARINGHGAHPRCERYYARLIELTRSPANTPRSDTVRVAALRAAVHVIRDVRVVPRVFELLEDPSAEVREAAVESVPPLAADITKLDTVLRRLEDPNRRVRTKALETVAAVARDENLPAALAALEARLASEQDVELRPRVTAAMATAVAKMPADKRRLTAKAWSTGDVAHKRAAAAVFQGLLAGDTLLADDARNETLTALAELHREIGEMPEAALAYRRLAAALRTKSPEIAAAKATAAFHCAIAGKQYRESWDWVGEWTVGQPEAQRPAALKAFLEVLAAKPGFSAEAVSEALSALAADAAWAREAGFVAGVAALKLETARRLDPKNPDPKTPVDDYRFQPTARPIASKVLADLELVQIPAPTSGKVAVGTDEPPLGAAKSNESPRHLRDLSASYFMGRTEVTYGQFALVMGGEKRLDGSYAIKRADGTIHNQPFAARGDAFPVTNLRHDDAIEFCKRLSKLESEKMGREVVYRLPTETEWEYACRGDPTGAGSALVFCKPADLNRFAVFGPTEPQRVAALRMGPFGLYDMLGNVWELCGSPYTDYKTGQPLLAGSPADDSYVARGGGHKDAPADLRCTVRKGLRKAGVTGADIGFRVVRER